MASRRAGGPRAVAPDQQKPDRYLRKEADFRLLNKADLANVDEAGFGTAVLEFLKAELAKTPGSGILRHDEQVLHEYAELLVNPAQRGNRVSMGEVLREIVLLAKIQSVVLSIFMFLHDQDLVTMEGLKDPMTLRNCEHDEIRAVINALDCFEFLEGMDKRETYAYPTSFSFSGYNAVRMWLATLIVRGALTTDMHNIVNRLSTFDGLGSLDRQALKDLWPETRELRVDKLAGLIPAPNPGRAESFCFFLPLAMGRVENIMEVSRSFDKHFVPLENLFFNFFKLDVRDDLPNEELPAGYLLERAKRKQSKKS